MHSRDTPGIDKHRHNKEVVDILVTHCNLYPMYSIYKLIHICICQYICVYIYTYVYIHINAYIHEYIYACTRKYTHAYYICVHIEYRHWYIYTHIYHIWEYEYISHLYTCVCINTPYCIVKNCKRFAAWKWKTWRVKTISDNMYKDGDTSKRTVVKVLYSSTLMESWMEERKKVVQNSAQATGIALNVCRLWNKPIQKYGGNAIQCYPLLFPKQTSINQHVCLCDTVAHISSFCTKHIEKHNYRNQQCGKWIKVCQLPHLLLWCKNQYTS